MASKYYAVKKGKKTGIFESWAECQPLVTGFPGAQFKSFSRREDAQSFLDKSLDKKTPAKLDFQTPVAYVDGSYNQTTGVYGYGGFLEFDGERVVLQGSGDNKELASMRNVAGEILGAEAAIKKAVEKHLRSLTIFYDYTGIEAWATGKWNANNEGTRRYQEFVQKKMKEMKISFQKVRGHSGVEGNEEADRLAKEAVGLVSVQVVATDGKQLTRCYAAPAVLVKLASKCCPSCGGNVSNVANFCSRCGSPLKNADDDTKQCIKKSCD